MPSVASEVNASLSLSPLQRPRPQQAGADSAPQPFAALLDAAAPAPETPPETDVQDAPQRTEPTVQTTGPRADNTSAKPASNAADHPNPRDSEEDTHVDKKIDKKEDAAASTKSDTKAKAKATDVSATPDANDGKDTVKDDGAGKDATTTVAAQTQAPATPQPIAAAIAVTGIITDANAPASDADKSGAIDAGKDAKPVILNPTATPAGDAKDTAAGDVDSGANPALADGKAVIPAPGNKPAADAKARPAEDSGNPVDGTGDKTSKGVRPDTAKASEQTDTSQSDTRREATPDLDGQSASAGSGGDTNQSAVKPNADALPNFGFSASSTTATSPTAGTSAPAATVPIAGLAVEIAARAQSGSTRFDIRLDPPELGRIDVRLDVDRDGQVTSHVTVERPETLTLLQHEQPSLERALEQAGLKTADNGLQFTLRDQSFTGQQSGQDNGGRSGQDTARLVIPDADLGTVETITSRYRSFGVGSGVDISV